MMLMNRWRLPCLASIAVSLWLLWALPRFHPAARLGLQTDRRGYLAQAGAVASHQHTDVTGWTGYAQAETLGKNQFLKLSMPNDPMARDFPASQVVVNFLPSSGATARVTLRPDGRPLAWKLPVPTAAPAGSEKAMATAAMHQMAGPLSEHFAVTSDGISGKDGMGYKWKASGTGEEPVLGVEATVKGGLVWQAKTLFTLPEAVARQFDTFPVARTLASSLWFLLLLVAVAIPILREGGGSTARAMKDRSAIFLSVAAAVIFLAIAWIEFDDELISVTVMTGLSTEIFSMIFSGLVVGLLFYGVNAATALNAVRNPRPVRGFRLLGTSAFRSRIVGEELLGGWLFAPLFVAVPLLVSAALRAPAFGGYEDALLLSRSPVPDAVLNGLSQSSTALLALAGSLIPLALRFRRFRWMPRVLIALFAFLTFAMLDSPFRGSQSANLMVAVLDGFIFLWSYSRFGMLGAFAGHAGSRILNAAGTLLLQPAASLRTTGGEVLFAFVGMGLLYLLAVLKGPEVVAELYSESAGRSQARSRREELLAEFNVARSAQQQMLPSQPPVLPGFTISASCEPAREVGGDLYDFVRLSDGRWGIGVADVSGKGVPAALYMTLTKGLLCAAAQDSGDPRRILEAVNKHLRTVTKKKMFVTMALGALDPEARRLEYVRAGHNPAVWRRTSAGVTRFLSGPGIGLGIAGPALFAKTLTSEIIDLESGDALIFYSDGLTEAMNRNLEEFGEDRLAAAVERADGMHATATRDSILEEVGRFLEGGHSQDDLTIAVLRVD
jgi:sigma-B regulation protein RsbU (phosphoserine phosphatase)